MKRGLIDSLLLFYDFVVFILKMFVWLIYFYGIYTTDTFIVSASIGILIYHAVKDSERVEFLERRRR